MRPKREGRSKGSRALAIDDEAGRTDRSKVSSCTFEYEKGSSYYILPEKLAGAQGDEKRVPKVSY